MTELVTSGSVGGMASNGCLYPEPDPKQRSGFPLRYKPLRCFGRAIQAVRVKTWIGKSL